MHPARLGLPSTAQGSCCREEVPEMPGRGPLHVRMQEPAQIPVPPHEDKDDEGQVALIEARS